MLYEFVIEPSLLNQVARSRRDYVEFMKFFSIGSPQVISDYPKIKNIRKQALRLQSYEVGEGEKQRLEDLVAFLSEVPRVKREAPYDGADWLKNIVTENGRVIFDHVLSSTPHAPLRVISLEQLYDGEITYPNQLPVTRVADDMAAAIASTLRLAAKVIFVDPYFNDRRAKWQPFIKFLRVSLCNRPGTAPRIEVLFDANKESTATPQYLADKLRREEPILADQCSVVFKSVRELVGGEKLHNRYVLTDIGGVFFGVGLDEESEGHKDDVALLNEKLYRLRWDQYAEMKGFETIRQAST
jgi:hypothetical protein